jgi:hypothetical protein
MSRLFTGKKELAFVAQIGKELIQRVVGQEVVYYQILAEKTKTNDLYNEAINKTYAVPVKTNCLVYYENTSDAVTNFPPDSRFNVDVYFHNIELKERNLEPRMGDFVQFGEVVYEIYQVIRTQIAFGQIDQKVMTHCKCGPARQGQFSLPIQPQQVPGEDLRAPRYSEQPRDFVLKGERK